VSTPLTPEPALAPAQAATSSRTLTATRVLFGTVLALYVLAFPYHPGLRSPNELCRLHQTRALVEYGTIELNQALVDFRPVGDLSVKDGRYYPSKAPLLSFAAVPLYAGLRVVGGGHLQAVPELPLVFWSRLLLTVLPTLLMLVLLRRFLGAYVPAHVSAGLTATYALGTLAFSYSLLFMSHQTTAVLVFGAFYALWRIFRGDWTGAKARWGYLGAGALCGASVAAEYTSALPVLALLAYGAAAVLTDKDRLPRARVARLAQAAGLAVLGALPFVVGLMAYHQAAFGHPLHSGYKYLADAGYQPWHLGGFLGIRYPDPRAFALSFFSPLRGLFALSPALLLALPGLVLLWKRSRRELGFTLLVLGGYTYFTSAFSYDSWGWTTGPRHLTPLVPFLMLPLALAYAWVRERSVVWAGALAGLCVASVAVTALATFVNYIPDDVANAVGSLALPLLRAGYLPPSVFSLLGVPNPLAGAALVALLAAALVAVAWVLVGKAPRRARAVALGLALIVGAGFVALHAASARHDRADQNAVAFLKSVWLAPPGKVVKFWP
jgi:hypothetical protein